MANKGGLLEQWMGSEFSLAFRKITHHHKQFWKIFLADIIFFVVVYLISVNLDFFIGPVQWINLVLLLIYLIVIFVFYTLIKSYIMKKIGGIITGKENWKKKLDETKDFFLLNFLILFGLFIIISIIGSLLYYGLRSESRPMIGLIVFVILFWFSYKVINISHSAFFKIQDKRNTIINSIKIFKKHFFDHCKILLFDIIMIAIFLVIISILGALLYYILLKPLNTPRATQIYNLVFTVLFSLYLYLIHYYNRIIFYIKTKM